MKHEEVLNALEFLGFSGGYAVGGEPAEIIIWENNEKQPTKTALTKAAKEFAATRQAEQAAAVKARESGIKKLAKLGLTEDEIAALIQS